MVINPNCILYQYMNTIHTRAHTQNKTKIIFLNQIVENSLYSQFHGVRAHHNNNTCLDICKTILRDNEKNLTHMKYFVCISAETFLISH